MNKTQVQTTSASLIGVIAGFLAGRGYFGLGLSDWTIIVGGLFSAAAVAWPAIITRAQSLKDTVGQLPKTTVITDTASAEALPNNPDVVASTPQIVKAINEAKAAS